MKNRYPRRNHQGTKGSGIVLISLVMALLAFTLVQIAEWNRWQQQSEQFARASEAAALAATQSLCRIVIDDPYWGYVSLSDWPAVGRRTLAVDGKSLPVTGINTLVATVRTNWLAAKQLHDSHMEALAERDIEKLNETINRLNDSLKASLKPDTSKGQCAFMDMDGNPVRPYDDARRLLKSNLPAAGKFQIESFKLDLGWLESGSATTTSIPEPAALAQVPENLQLNKRYLAFKDITAAGKSFRFAGVGENSSLVRKENYRTMIKDMPCSIVCLEATCVVDCPGTFSDSNGLSRFKTQQCAQPSAMDESQPHGWLVLGFADGRPPGVNSIRDLLASPLLSRAQTDLYQPDGGDFPDEATAVLSKVNEGTTVQNEFARVFYDWIRSNHGHVKLDSIADVVDLDFRLISTDSSPYKCYLLQFDEEGTAHVVVQLRNPFERLTVPESQLYSYNSTPLPLSGAQWTVTTRDLVANLGRKTGGKHGGQPLSGTPINWCSCDGYREVNLRKLSDAKHGIRAYVDGPVAANGHIINEDASQFFLQNRTVVPRRLRSELFCGGICGEFRLASIGN